MKLQSFLLRLSITTKLLLSTSFIVLSGLLINAHGQAVRDMRDLGLPAAVELPVLQRKVNVLSEQAELTRMQAMLESSTVQELFRMSVFPAQTDIPKGLELIDVLLQELGSNLLHTDAIVVGQEERVTIAGQDAVALPLTLSFTARPGALASFINMLSISGMQTVGDSLSIREREELTKLTEEENPAAIVALEQFLGSDILRYAREPQAFDNQLEKAFSSQERINQLRELLDHSGLGRIHIILTPSFTEHLVQAKVWPMRLVSLEGVKVQMQSPESTQAELTLKLWSEATH